MNNLEELEADLGAEIRRVLDAVVPASVAVHRDGKLVDPPAPTWTTNLGPPSPFDPVPASRPVRGWIAVAAAGVAIVGLAGMLAILERSDGSNVAPADTGGITSVPETSTQGTSAMSPGRSTSAPTTTIDARLTVPDVRGLPVAEATRQLDAAGIAWRAVEKANGDIPAGLIVSSVPGVGNAIAPDEVVVLEVSNGLTSTPATRAAPPSSAPVKTGNQPAFTPLMLSPVPAGLSLQNMTYTTGSDGFDVGTATYVSNDLTTVLELVLSNDMSLLAEIESLGGYYYDTAAGWVVPDGREHTWDCTSASCSIGWAWNDHTYISLRWLQTTGASSSATLASLVEIVPSVTESTPATWQLVAV